MELSALHQKTKVFGGGNSLKILVRGRIHTEPLQKCRSGLWVKLDTALSLSSIIIAVLIVLLNKMFTEWFT